MAHSSQGQASQVQGIHHVNFLVADLDAAMDRWQEQLGVREFIVDDLPGRGVRTARFRAGESWVVLVQPVAEGEPMRVLRERGEGLFLLSLAVASIEDTLAGVLKGGGALTSPAPRTGLDGWQVIDLDPAHICGAQVQVTDSA